VPLLKKIKTKSKCIFDRVKVLSIETSCPEVDRDA
jgi:hypothetical protein